MDTVQELQEDRGETAPLRVEGQAAPLTEFMPEREPLFFNQHPEAFKCPIKGITE